MPKSKIAPETKAAVITGILNGASSAYLAQKHGIDQATVRSWKMRMDVLDPLLHWDEIPGYLLSFPNQSDRPREG